MPPVVNKTPLNRVQQSRLEILSVADFMPTARICTLDIAQGMIDLPKEAPFRAWVKDQQWDKYQGTYVGLVCSLPVIVPAWMYVLVTSALAPHCLAVRLGSAADMRRVVFADALARIDWSTYAGKRIMLQGCNSDDMTTWAYVLLAEYLLAHVSSLMYGEPCSAVPIFKKKLVQKKASSKKLISP